MIPRRRVIPRQSYLPARRTDPDSSHDNPTGKTDPDALDAVKDWLRSQSPDSSGTERELGTAIHDALPQEYENWEEGRRQVRYMEDDGILVWAFDYHTKKRIRHHNKGKKAGWGYTWRLRYQPPKLVPPEESE